MNKSDLLTVLGLSTFGVGLYFIYHPLPFLFAGAVLIVFARGIGRGRAIVEVQK
jgi:hypothetical protein